jgi:hypothetical protein
MKSGTSPTHLKIYFYRLHEITSGLNPIKLWLYFILSNPYRDRFVFLDFEQTLG